MSSVNLVILLGNATRDAELHHTQSGKAGSSIRLAANRTINRKEESQFNTTVCWDKIAETVARCVKKVDPLYIESRLHYRSFQDDEAKERGIVNWG